MEIKIRYFILIAGLFSTLQCGGKNGGPGDAATTAVPQTGAPAPTTTALAACVNQCFWNTPQLLNTAYPVGAPTVAMNANGNAITIWIQGAGSARDAYFSLQGPQFGIWGTAAPTKTGGPALLSPEIAMDATGNALMNFIQTQTGIDYFFYGSRYDVLLQSWDTPVLIANVAPYIYNNLISADVSGNFFTVWIQKINSRYEAWANRYNNATRGWGTAGTLQIKAETAGMPQIAPPFAVWQQTDAATGVSTVWANRYDETLGGWTGATILKQAWEGSQSPTVAADPSGNAIVVWEEREKGGTENNIYANRYDATTIKNWTSPQMIENLTGRSGQTRVVMDSKGNAIAIWRTESSPGQAFDLVANRYDAALGAWGTPQMIEGTPESIDDSTIKADPAGNAMVVFRHRAMVAGAVHNLSAVRFNVATGSWEADELLETAAGTISGTPRLAIDAYGRAIVIWLQHDGTNYSIFSRAYH